MSERMHDREALIIELEDVAMDFTNPERTLLAAILVNAFYDLKKTGMKSRQAREFFLNPDSDYIFSFRSICSYLSIDPSLVLERVGLDQQAM